MSISMRPGVRRPRLRDGQVCELVVADLDNGETKVIYETGELIEAPNWTPDGRWLIFNADGRLHRISPDGTEGPCRVNTAPVENLNNDHVITPDGNSVVLSANDGHLYVVPITGGAPHRISEDKEAERGYRHYLHGISPDGAILAYVALERGPGGGNMTRIATMPIGGGPETYLTDGTCPVDGPEYDPSGNWIYFNSEAAAAMPGQAQIFRMRSAASGDSPQQLTHDARVNWFPHLSPDGQAVAYISFPTGTLGHPGDKAVIIRVMQPDGTGQRDIDAFNGGQGSINVNSWAPDSRRFAYVRYPIAV